MKPLQLLLGVVGALYALLSTITHANIYTPEIAYEPTMQQQCFYNGDEIYKALDAYYSQRVAYYYSQNSDYYEYRNPSKDPIVYNYYESFCTAFLPASMERWKRDGLTEAYPWYLNGAVSVGTQYNGYYQETETCIDHPSGAIIPYTIDGTLACFRPEDLAANDTCESMDSYFSQTSGLTCASLVDGSECKILTTEFVIEGSDGVSTYQYKYAPESNDAQCYENNNSEESPFNAPTSYCESIGGGVVMCAEEQATMCPNGQCQSGCGTINVGSGDVFVCLSSDTDNDLVPDYADSDLDGDGIKNEDDLDWDGDGIEDPDYSSGRNGSTSTNPLNGSTTSGSGETVSVDEQAIVDGVVNGLTESGDFSISDFVQAVDLKTTEYDNSIDSLLNSSETDFVNTIDESGLSNSVDSLKSILNSSSCAANFEIPFTTNTIDFCGAAQKVQPFLYVIFAISTFIYCYRRVASTARGVSE